MADRPKTLKILLYACLVATVLLLGFYGTKFYSNYLTNQVSQEQQAINFQESLQAANEEISQLKAESQQVAEESKNQISALEERISEEENFQMDISPITASDLNKYLSAVVQINCENSSGSGVLWSNFGDLLLITNEHVVTQPIFNQTKNEYYCIGWAYALKGYAEGLFTVNPYESWSFNDFTDIAIMTTEHLGSNMELNKLEELNFLEISDTRLCPNVMEIGSPVALVGYPAFGEKSVAYGDTEGTQSFRITTDGIISGHDTSVNFTDSAPYPNYFVSAKIDSGNSGGIAFSKDKDGICVLGVPTWLTVGNYETQGLVQNMQNIIY
ncbi:hypothetical protein A2239_00075 [Candidatus Uhrbacteria bacterium RIFOXYA2_FULL_40_9]|nr:MAG: hypothetical protein UT94_C0002G0037 [Candidatus Uhrbacteria bacterium GW2011_GWF2_40_263]OGL93478.1 MAG: hypothetical protein A2239_00075 [Candidatus Uhrbacteria bacterium RIFOXYA2_FULL_40_9]OGL97379.1 MAG: hypothetical protein A2332_04640 [Candidatus Uhrbacteria bacterium RIFOXYB2_FULL_41_18]HBK35033.1 hypothetical protein [Candidatus Uhrbacteria bacterium]HCB56186.1 hypothetical protein [Candidatus Uhrbacteria bacterium]